MTETLSWGNHTHPRPPINQETTSDEAMHLHYYRRTIIDAQPGSEIGDDWRPVALEHVKNGSFLLLTLAEGEQKSHKDCLIYFAGLLSSAIDDDDRVGYLIARQASKSLSVLMASGDAKCVLDISCKCNSPTLHLTVTGAPNPYQVSSMGVDAREIDFLAINREIAAQ